jgi:DNA-binding transcriptional LysR family regulator
MPTISETMIPNLSQNALIVFYIVAREKSLSSAAEKVHLTQPAISYQIKSLERHARVKLLEFKNRRVTLTQHGQELFKYAETIYQQLVEAERYLKLQESNLRVGIACVYDAFVLPLLHPIFEGQNTQVKLIIKSGNSLELVQDVLDSILDVAIVLHFDYQNDKLNQTQVSLPEKIVCFGAPQQPLPEAPLEWKDLHAYPLIGGPETSVLRRIIFEKFKEEGLPTPSWSAEVNNIELCKNLVERGKGLSFTLANDIQDEVAAGRFKLVPLRDYLYVPAEAVTRSDVSNPIIEKFISLVKKALNYSDMFNMSGRNQPIHNT